MRTHLFLAFLAGLCAAALNPAFAADLPSRQSAPALAAAPVSSWAGFYAGAGAGAALFADPVWDAEAFSTGYQQVGTSLSPSYAAFGYGSNARLLATPVGALGLALVGYNFQAGNFVYGAEGACGVPLGANKTATYATPSLGAYPAIAQVSKSYDFACSFGPRLGYLFTPNTLLYGTTGGALVQTSAGVTSGAPLAIAAGYGSSRRVDLGWMVGGGVEYQFAPGWRFGVGYKYVDAGKRTVSLAGLQYGQTPGFAATNYIVNGNTASHVVEVTLRKSLDFLPAPALFAPTGNVSADLATAKTNADATLAQIQSTLKNGGNATAIVNTIKTDLANAGL